MAFFIVEHFRKRDRPMQEVLLRGGGIGCVEKSLRNVRRQRRRSIEQRVDQGAERPAVRRVLVWPEPSGAPEVEHPSMTAERSLRRLQRGQRTLFRANDRGRFVPLACELRARLYRVAKHGREIGRLEQPGVPLPTAASAASAICAHAATRKAPLPIAGSRTRSRRISSAVLPASSGRNVSRTTYAVSVRGV